MAKKCCVFFLSAIIFLKYVAGSSNEINRRRDLISLTFVIDDTSSMSDDIAQVRQGASAIFDTVQSNRDESQIDNFIIVTFNDMSDQRYAPDLKLRAKTKVRSVFMSALSAITTSGGAITCAELPMAGIKRGLEESLPKSSIYVFTDATAKDYDQYQEVKRIAQTKQCQIVFVLTGQCGQPVTSQGYKVYQDLARDTNGQVFHLDKGEVNKILEYVKRTITGSRTTLTNKVLGRGQHNLTFEADRHMTDVLVSLGSSVANNPTVNIKAPDGSNVPKTQLFQTNNAKVYSVNVTQLGQHTVEVNSPAETRAVVTAKTGINFQHGFSTFLPSSIDDTSIRPAPGVQSRLSIQLTNGNIDIQSVQILDMNRNVIRTLPLAVANAQTKFYTTEAFDPPTTDFIIAVNGNDPNSRTRIIREATTPIEVQRTLPGETINNRAPTVVIEGAGKINASFGDRLQIVCKVEAYPRPDIVWKNKQTGQVLSSQVSMGKNFPYDYVNVLSIERAIENATYTCESRNRLNNDLKEVTVEVTRRGLLKITSRAKNETVEYKQDTKFFCRVDADTPAVITWYKNDVELKTGGNIRISIDNTIVSIKEVTPADNGKYTCEARNEARRETVDNFLKVAGVDNVELDKRVSDVSAIRRHSTTVECKILKGNPKPSISWTFETPQKKIYSIENWKDKEINVLIGVSDQDAGIYRCRAENDFSRDHHEVHLEVV